MIADDSFLYFHICFYYWGAFGRKRTYALHVVFFGWINIWITCSWKQINILSLRQLVLLNGSLFEYFPNIYKISRLRPVNNQNYILATWSTSVLWIFHSEILLSPSSTYLSRNSTAALSRAALSRDFHILLFWIKIFYCPILQYFHDGSSSVRLCFDVWYFLLFSALWS